MDTHLYHKRAKALGEMLLGLFLVDSCIPVDVSTFIDRRPAWTCVVICRTQWWKLTQLTWALSSSQLTRHPARALSLSAPVSTCLCCHRSGHIHEYLACFMHRISYLPCKCYDLPLTYITKHRLVPCCDNIKQTGIFLRWFEVHPVSKRNACWCCPISRKTSQLNLPPYLLTIGMHRPTIVTFYAVSCIVLDALLVAINFFQSSTCTAYFLLSVLDGALGAMLLVLLWKSEEKAQILPRSQRLLLQNEC